MKNDISRRHFLRQASCAALGSTSLLSTLTNLKFMNSAAMSSNTVIGGNDYKALVCILMTGGNDSFNMLIPNESSAYNIYQNTRSNLAIPRDQILPLSGSSLGLHPAMSGIQNLYNNQQLSFISNIGTLVTPLTKDEVLTSNPIVPLGLFSHSDQVQQWQTSVPNDRSSIGWGGKIADLMTDVNDNKDISINISLGGSNIFQTGQSTVEYSLDRENGAVGIIGYNDNSNPFLQLRNNAIDNILDAHYDDLYQRTYVDVIKRSRDTNVQFSEGLNNTPFLRDLFDTSDFGNSMHIVAKSIAAREALGMRRQIFFVESPGWDHHDEVLMSQEEMLTEISAGFAGFQRALERIDAEDCVTTFTASEFGRTLASNGQGTDHAWGGNVMVMGGPVRGGQIYGEYPLLEIGGEQELGRPNEFSSGIMLPTTSVDQYFAELALWFGVLPSDLSTVFPNIGNFYNTGSGQNPIGFLD